MITARKIFILSLQLLCIGSLTAQEMQELNTFTRKITATIDLAAGRLSEVQIQGAPEISDLQLQIENGELLLTYRLPSTTDERYYLPTLSIRLNGEPITPYPEDLKGDLQRALKSSADRKRIVWTDLLENDVNLQGQLEMELQAALWGIRHLPYGIICGTPPLFGPREHLPYYLSAGVGVAAIGLGQVFRARRDKIYDDYRNAGNIEASRPILDNANTKHQSYLLLTWFGTALLTADAALYLLRRNRHKKQLQVYEEFCGGAYMTVRPLFQPALGSRHSSMPNGRTGMKLTLRF